jgi:nitroreductase
MIKVIDFISHRYSPTAFDKRVPTKEDLLILFEAAQKAPSAFNEQPWRFIYTTTDDQPAHRKFLDCLVDANKLWAKTAPVLALSLAKKTLTRNGKPNFYAHYDTGMAIGNLLVQAMSQGLYVHQMGGYDRNKAISNLEIPDDFEPMAMMAIGYPGNLADLPAELHERAIKRSVRKNIDEVVYYGRIGL